MKNIFCLLLLTICLFSSGQHKKSATHHKKKEAYCDTCVYGFWCSPLMDGYFHFHNYTTRTVYIDSVKCSLSVFDCPSCEELTFETLIYVDSNSVHIVRPDEQYQGTGVFKDLFKRGELIDIDTLQEPKVYDTILGHFSLDTIYGKTKEGYVTKEWKWDVDSSNWLLYKIENDTFHYIKEYSYGTYNSIDYPEDTIKAWKKDHELNPNHFYISAYSDLVGHGVKIYRKTNYLLPGSQLTDTIPQKVYYSDMEGNETIHYMVGGDVFGECIRITPNYEAIAERKKNKKHKR
jgi:hypothetical protein